MEPETVIVPPQANPEPPAPVAAKPSFLPKQPPKLLYIFGGVAVILFSIALAIVFFGNKQGSTTGESGSSDTVVSQDTTGWPKYGNVKNFYELAIPPKWVAIKRSPLEQDSVLFDAENTATLEITAAKVMPTLDEYLASQDDTNKSVIKSNKSSAVKVGAYDGYERAESWPTLGLQVVTTYVKISDMLYTFTLIPAGDKSAVTNEAIIRDYRASLSSFRLTDTTQLGLDLKTYTSQKVEGLSFPAFSLKYPQTWVASEQYVGKDLIVSVYRNNYEIKITQAPVGGAVCLFKDSPDFQGSSGDLRSKDFTEFNTAGGVVMRRYFNKNEGDKSTMFFCRKETDSPYFSTPTDIGGIVYYVPAKFDNDIVREMDEIVKSIMPSVASPSATNPWNMFVTSLSHSPPYCWFLPPAYWPIAFFPPIKLPQK